MAKTTITQTQFADAIEAVMNEAIQNWDDREVRAAAKATCKDIRSAMLHSSRALGKGLQDTESVERGRAAARRVLGL